MSAPATTTTVTKKKRFQMFEALGHRDYRLFWLGSLASVMGFQMLMLTQGWLMYDLTGSKLQLGLIGLASAAPSILLNLFGGVVADKVDQRKLIMATQLTAGLIVVALGVLTLAGSLQPWHLMVSALLMGGVGAFDMPSRQAIFPYLVDRGSMMNAVALNSMIWQGTRIVGPALGGVIISYAGPASTFLIASAGFMVFVALLAVVHVPRVERSGSGRMIKEMGEGLSYVRDNPVFAFLLGMTFFNSFFGMSYITLMPVFQKDILLVDEKGLGLLLGVGGAGAFVGTFAVASVGKKLPKGWLIIGGGLAFGAAIVAFGVSHWFLLSLGLAFLAGLASSVYMIAVQGTLQMLVPDRFRGRVMGFWGMAYNLMPLGGFQAGVVANYMGAPIAVGVGGALVMAFALLGAARNARVRSLGAAEHSQ
ncbi:MAG: MFS transporter [Chloroflexi bacterium]|nr:MFS transporter [Chloroflexota bacterium]